ncbi:hypothetical protein ABZ470_31725 [Streptosporangium sp. NPDC020072]|uniref:hypothetical protein n=1 Tax=Streptosporangium sp. NPDC020072 TaxID=3154788 RepID=UPI0034448221
MPEGTKVGSGYVEIRPELVGFDTLKTKIDTQLKGITERKFNVAPKIVGITKAWQEEVQSTLNQKVKDLTVKVAVRLDKDTVTATFSGVTVAAVQAGQQSGDGLSKGFQAATATIKRLMREVDVAIKAGLTPERSWDVEKNLGVVSNAYRDMVEDIEAYSDREVTAIRSGITELETLQNRVSRTIQRESNAVKKANDDIEAEVKRTIAETDRLVSSAETSMERYRNTVARNLENATRALKPHTESIRTEFSKIAPAIEQMSGNSLRSMDKFNRGVFDTQKVVREGFREATEKGMSDVARLFEGFARDNGITLARTGERVGRSFGSALSDAIDTTVRFGIARLVVGLPTAIATVGYLLSPVASAVSSLASGFAVLGGQAAYAAGALAAVPAVFGAIIQGGATLGLAFAGVSEALTALQADQDKGGRNSQAMADAMEAANRRVQASRRSLADAQEQTAARIADAEERLQRAVESSADRIADAQARLVDVTADAADRITDAEDRLAEAQADAATRIAESQARLADVQAAVADRIADAQARLVEVAEASAERITDAEDRLTRAREDAAERVAAAEERLTRARADGARRVTDAEADYARTLDDVTTAQDALNAARATARERIEDLKLALSGGQLDEEAAAIAVEKAAERLRNLTNDPDATPRDLHEADLAYRQAVQKLDEIREKNEDLRQQQEKADRDGIEGSKEVTDAKDAIQKAIEKQIEAEQRLADARRDSAESIADAEKALADARRDAVRSVTDAEGALTDARKQGAKQIADAEKGLSDARIDGAKQVEAAERAANDAAIEGAKRVAKAEKDLQDSREDGVKQIARAEKDLQDARRDGARDVLDAEKALADARKKGARDIADAQRALREAIEDVAKASEKENTQAYNAEVALRKLSPAAREFVLYLDREFLPKIREIQWSVQDAFYPPLQAALEKSDGLLDLFGGKLTDTGRIFGNFAGDVIDWLNTDEEKNRIGRIMDSNNRIFQILAGSADEIGDAVGRMVERSGPFLERMAGLVTRIINRVSEMVQQADDSGKLTDFFGRVGDTLERISGIAGDIGRILIVAFDEAYPPGEKLLGLIGDNVKEFADWIESTEGRQTLRDWFEKGRAAMEELGGLIKDIVVDFKDLGDNVDFATIIRSVREDLLPAIVKVAKALAGDEGEGIIGLIKAFSDALDVLAPIITLVGEALDLMMPDDWPNTLQVAKNELDLFSGGFKYLSGDVEDGSKQMSEGIKGIEDDFKKIFGVSLRDVAKKAANTWYEFKDDVGDTLDQWGFDLRKWWSDLIAGFTGTMQSVKDSVVRKFEEISTWIQNWGPAILALVRSLMPDWAKVGWDIVQGLWDGMRGQWDRFMQWWRDSVANIEGIARMILQQNSPSLAMKRVGEGVGEGLALGIRGSMSLVADATRAMASSVEDSWPTLTMPALTTAARPSSPPRSARGEQLFRTQPHHQARPERTYNIALHAAPTTPTERQLLTVLSYADSLYN